MPITPIDGSGGNRVIVPVRTVSTSNSGATKPGTTTTKRKSNGRALPEQNNTDPYGLIFAKTTAGHKATWDGGHGHYVST